MPQHLDNQYYDESLTVSTAEGLEVYIETVDPVDGVDLTLDVLPPAGRPTPTLVFVHGPGQDMGTFYVQRAELARLGEWRMVFYDQPRHGRSARPDEETYTPASLGRALRQVVEQAAPGEPVVLIGHSTGWIAITAMAELYPSLVAERLVATVLIGGTAAQPGAGPPHRPKMLARPGRPPLPATGASTATEVMPDRTRSASGRIAGSSARRFRPGAARPGPTPVCDGEQMRSRTPTQTIAGCLRTLSTPAGFPPAALRGLPLLVVVGDQDAYMAARTAASIRQRTPAVELVVVPGGGHFVQPEQEETVNAALLRFLAKVCP